MTGQSRTRNNSRCLLLSFFFAVNIFIGIYIYYSWGDSSQSEIEVSRLQPFKSANDDGGGVFKPSKEWQKLGKDQLIPRGLHVRINMQTGEREAKILSSEADEEKTKNDLVKAENLTVAVPSKNSTFRYRDLEKLFPKTESEILRDLMKEFEEIVPKLKGADSVDKKSEEISVGILKDLENVIHQVDVARDFAKMGGMEKVIAVSLASNSTRIRYESARVLGSAVQNNAKVQIAALEAGAISSLLKLIALDDDITVKSSCIFALSCLVRSFPFAQRRMIDTGGLSVLLPLMDDVNTAAGHNVRIKLKIVSLFDDLLEEKSDVLLTIQECHGGGASGKNDENQTDYRCKKAEERLRQLEAADLKGKLFHGYSWCSKLARFMLEDSVIPINQNAWKSMYESDVNHDIISRTANAMTHSLQDCKEIFRGAAVPWHNLLPFYQKLSLASDNTDSYYGEIYEQLKTLRDGLE